MSDRRENRRQTDVKFQMPCALRESTGLVNASQFARGGTRQTPHRVSTEFPQLLNR